MLFSWKGFCLVLLQVLACKGKHLRVDVAKHNMTAGAVNNVISSTDLFNALKKTATVVPGMKLDRYAVNFGAGDGFSAIPMAPGAHDWQGHADPTWHLYKDEFFAGLAVEGNAQLLPVLQKNLPSPNITKISAWITPHTVLQLLRTGNAPIDMDYFKNDIDAYDCSIVYTVLKGGYRPKIVHVEVNPEIPYPVMFGVNYSPNFKSALGAHGFYGCSVSLSAGIIMPFGYAPVGVSPTHDVIFMRSDLIPGSGLTALTAEQAQVSEEACCQAPHFGQLLNRQVLTSLANNPPQLLEAMKQSVATSCVLTQGQSTTVPGECNTPYTLSLDAGDYVRQFDKIIASGAGAAANPAR